MSLQIWLPLNGDLKQQGLSGINATMIGTGITYSAGKIGQAAIFPNSCSSYIYLPRMRLQTGTYAAWIKVIGVGGASRQCIISEGRDSYDDGVEIYTDKAGTSLSFKAHEKIITTIITLNQWYHVVGTFGNGEIKLYINGTLVGSNTYTAEMTYRYASDLVLGKMSYNYTSTSNYFPFNGYLNDVRIYDHCLSDKEVEEISKGLVLHYKLDDAGLANPNLITDFDTSFLTYNIGTTTLFTNQMNNGTQEIISNIEGAQKCLHFHGAGGQNRAYKTLNLSNGKIYTISLDYYSPNNQPTAIHGELNGGNYSWTNCGNAAYSVNQGKWQRLTYTTPQLTSNATLYYFIHCINGYDCYIKNIKVEEGSFASPWCNYKTDIIYDSSGYNNDGTIVGSLIAVADSARYNCATHLENHKYITYLLSQNMYHATYSFWVKASSYTSYGVIHSAVNSPSNGNVPWFAVNTEGAAVWAYFGNNSPNYTKPTGSLSTNTWHHLVYVWNNGVAQWYVDGAAFGSSVTYTTRNYITNGVNAAIGNSYTGTSWNGTPFDGQLSDFRIYATALTAAQIKELYNTSMTIDNNGNTYARELVEK